MKECFTGFLVSKRGTAARWTNAKTLFFVAFYAKTLEQNLSASGTGYIFFTFRLQTWHCSSAQTKKTRYNNKIYWKEVYCIFREHFPHFPNFWSMSQQCCFKMCYFRNSRFSLTSRKFHTGCNLRLVNVAQTHAQTSFSACLTLPQKVFYTSFHNNTATKRLMPQ